jgi:hypothetical protein
LNSVSIRLEYCLGKISAWDLELDRLVLTVKSTRSESLLCDIYFQAKIIKQLKDSSECKCRSIKVNEILEVYVQVIATRASLSMVKKAKISE